MAFKSINTYNEEKFGDFFRLVNDGDSADVVFLYQSTNDVLVADVHYIKSADYSGYVHCCGSGCPACGKGIRVQTKLFIPMLNMTENKIQFWDRTLRFEPQLQSDVFASYPNPSEYVFKITRHGAARDVNTTYEIRGIAKNSSMPYAKILADYGISLPQGYESICKDLGPVDMNAYLDNNASVPSQEYNYIPTPRSSAPVQVTPPAPVNMPSVSPEVFNEPPQDLLDQEDDSTDSLDDVDF